MLQLLHRPLLVGVLLLVVLANLLLGVVLVLQGDPAPLSQATDSFGEPLAMIDRASIVEGAEEASVPAAAAEELSNLPNEPVQCRFWGPFEDEAQADGLLEALVQAAVLESIGDGRVTSELLELAPDYLIYVGPYDNQAAARGIRDDLRELGSDASVVSRTGQLVVSVGVFSQRRFADAQVAKLEDWGFTPQRRELLRSQRVFFVMADIDHNQRLMLGDTSPQLLAAGNCQTIASQFRLL